MKQKNSELKIKAVVKKHTDLNMSYRMTADEMNRQRLVDLERGKQTEKLLAGMFDNVENIKRDLSRVGLSLDSEDYMIWFIKVRPTPRLLFSEQADVGNPFQMASMLLERISKEKLKHLGNVIVQHIDLGTVCIIGLEHLIPGNEPPKDGTPDFLETHLEAAKELVDTAKQKLGIEPHIYMGRPHSGIEGIPAAFNDVTNMMNYCTLLDDQNSIVKYLDFELMMQDTPSGQNSVKLIKEYLINVERKDFYSAKETMEKILDWEFIQKTPSPDTLRLKLSGITYLLLSSFEGILDKNEMDTCLYSIQDLTSSSARGLTLNELRRRFGEMFGLVSNCIQHYENSKWPTWVVPLLEYVNEGITDPSLSVAQVASAFKLTPTYVSKVMKDYLGMGLLEYIQRKRIALVIQLLDSEMKLGEIAAKSGFSDVRSMRRVFQKYEGTTPKEFSQNKVSTNY